MNHPHKASVPAPSILGQSKILVSEFPGRTGVLIEVLAHVSAFPGRTGVLIEVLAHGHQKQKVKNFKNAKEAVGWCERHKAAFLCLHPAAVGGN